MVIYFEQVKKDSIVEKIDNNITRFSLGPYISCSYFIKDRKNVLVDASYPLMKPTVDEEVDIVVLTHGHFDHSIFLEEIVKAHNPKVYATKKTSDWLEKYKDEFVPNDLKSKYTELLKRWKYPPEVHSVKVTNFVKEGDIINTGSLSFRILETDGHCPGEVCLHEENKGILFSGDILLGNNIYGTPNYRGGDKKLLDESIKRLKSLKVVKLCPGHLL